MTINKIRMFNRYYTSILGVFDQQTFGLPYSMIELRILGTIGRHDGITANTLIKTLNIKKSYLSRIVSKLEKDGYIIKQKNQHDSRSFNLYLTKDGTQLNDFIEKKSDEQIATLLASLDETDLKKLTTAMATIKNILGPIVPDNLEED
ncbi:MarR family winged helix-turn-helix transcriptional regulator [Brochothrix thermosphacta]|uniref:MarR family winged helix-turn-helix transcriptional regulator n=1 Tax=Brochothrix thermosphacta TaxID=2756 RepID=UPI001969633F|nr:MarR family winged helix-turn-helix transcriptional regulator [Brochothrix thermosphacta]